MTDEGKKISFGFAKSIKKSTLKIVPPQEEKKVDYIECLDGKSIKVVGEGEEHNTPLVIPLLGSKTWYDRILNKTDADIFENKTGLKKNGIKDPAASGEMPNDVNGATSLDLTRIKTEKADDTENATKSLEEQAASEILNELHTGEVKAENPDLQVPITENGNLRGEAEPTLEDYEQIPIDSFGLAMLRGMGWNPDKGIGKNAKLVTAVLPELRPRGMGLGADKVTLQKQKSAPKSKEEEELKLDKGAFVKIIAGKYANYYGQIQCFDDEAGRVTVKITLTGESESLAECLVQPVTSAEYTKYSKVLNTATYEEYKNKKRPDKDRDGSKSSELNAETSDEEDSRKRRVDNDKRSKKQSNYTSDESTDSDRKSRKRRDSSDVEKDHRHKRTKKSKKSHRRDSSTEHSRKKSKKRDKDRHKVRERGDANSESADHKKHKKHKRSRSRSPARR